MELTIEKPLNNSNTQLNDILKNQNKILSILIPPTQTQDQLPEQQLNPISTDDLEFFIYSNPNKEIKV